VISWLTWWIALAILTVPPALALSLVIFRRQRALLVTAKDNRVALIRIIPLRCAACGRAFQDGEPVVNAENGAIAHLSCPRRES
jgi:hypothetical protein